MKVTADELAHTLEGGTLYLQYNAGGMYRVTGITSTSQEKDVLLAGSASDTLLASHHCGRPGARTHEELCILADKKDAGIRPPEQVLRELLASIDYASPAELKSAAEWLTAIADNFAKRSTLRHIARELAPVVRKLGK